MFSRFYNGSGQFPGAPVLTSPSCWGSLVFLSYSSGAPEWLWVSRRGTEHSFALRAALMTDRIAECLNTWPSIKNSLEQPGAPGDHAGCCFYHCSTKLAPCKFDTTLTCHNQKKCLIQSWLEACISTVISHAVCGCSLKWLMNTAQRKIFKIQ